ncbi:MAG: membrane integrity-associated transporter subunit PqiC [Burkholderiaceae bacterium]|nr:membrane integrity-associated transporter subunit PqiC [Burkholderiaceae bacterium]
MSRAASSRQRRLLLLAACVAPLAAGCVSIGRDAPARVSYELHDLGRAKPAPGAPLDLVVLVGWSSANTFYDSTSIVYSRTPGALAWYQFASWSERPAEQLGRLFVRRLAGSGVFRDVATLSGAVRGDWLVELQLERMLHDDANPPGVARISVFARIVDRANHRTVDSRRFDEEEPLATESAAGAVKAFDVAVTRLLDASVSWVAERATRALPEAAR